MKILIKALSIAVLLLGIVNQCFATHNRAGEIVYKHISGYKYKIIVYTYCYTETEADRDELEVDCGDGKPAEVVKRISKTMLDDANSLNISYLCKNIYEGEHTFSGPGTYILYMEDPNRNEGVSNIPNSVNVVFAIKTTLTINMATGNNSSPVLLNAPMDKAALNRTFIHNPGAYDPDGDSLSYRIATCLQQDGQEIVGYTLPPVTDTIFVNPITGDFIWEKPSRVGTYNVAMWIEEWRHGHKIGQVLRDIQVEVIDTDNHTPVIDRPGQHCVLAGNKVEFDVTASDPDRDEIQLSASGGPFAVEESPAEFSIKSIWSKNPVGHFSWQTVRSHIRNQPYEVLIKAVDSDPKVPLTGYNTAKIRVIAPKPEITYIQPANRTMKLTWNRGGNTNAVGYKIYRKDTKDDFEPGVCETGLPGYTGYKLVEEITNPKDTSYTDNDHGLTLPAGFKYCYRVTAVFADGAESIVSDKQCAIMTRNMVMLTKASVEQTSETEGRVIVEWTKPEIEKIDPEMTPPPFHYDFYKKTGIEDGVYYNPEKLMCDDQYEPTTYTDIKTDTKNAGHTYKLDFSNEELADFGTGTEGSTVYISLKCSDRKIEISHQCEVPWQNDTFIIYRKDPGATSFDSIGYSLNGKYTDRDGLVNGQTYGYLMKTIGHYSTDDLPTHIENMSQEAYGMPIDTIPPCVKINLKSICDERFNHLTWTPDTACGLGIEKYFIYYSETIDGNMNKIDEAGPEVLEYKHYPTSGMAGCYYVTARDSAGNEGLPSTRICVDQCDYYRLPNIFTPNGDGNNDLFHPYPYQFVDHVDMTITNRWGKVVFKTTDPDLNWDGTDQNTGNPVPDGVYHYRCTVYEHRLTGLEDREISGYITIYSKPSPKQN